MSSPVNDLEVAVIIVSFRSAELTMGALRSLEAERSTSGIRIRAIVVDNDSGDLPIIAPLIDARGWSSWVTLVAAPRNGGFAYGNNLGIERAFSSGRPSYIHLLNPDTQVRPGALASLVRFLENHPAIGIAGGSFENEDGSLWPISFRFPGLLSELDSGLELSLPNRVLRRWMVAREMPQDAPQPVDWISGASMMIRPEVFAAIGGLDENYFLYFEETDFCYRARKAGFQTWYVPGSRVMHIAGQSTGVNSPAAQPRRMPAYWFESRRRYFAMTYGVGKAILIDLVALSANLIGRLKYLLRLRTYAGSPGFLPDLARHSIILRGNRSFPPPRCSAAVRMAATRSGHSAHPTS